MNNNEISLVELIETDPRYRELKNEISKYTKYSDEYYLELFKKLPLSSWPDYKKFLKHQAVPIKNTESAGFSPIYRSSLSKEKLVTCFDNHKLYTYFDHFKFSARVWAENDCLGIRPYDTDIEDYADHYEYMNYQEVYQKAQNIAGGIMTLVNSKRKTSLSKNEFIVSILSHNNPEWVLTDLACQFYSLTNTALYETLGADTSSYILNLTQSPILFFAKCNLYKIIEILPQLNYLNTLVCFEPLTTEELTLLNEALMCERVNTKNEKVTLFSLKQLEELGKLSQIPIIPPKPEDDYTISFTSGTTGVPKGVIMTQKNIAAGIAFGASTFKLPTQKLQNSQLHDLCFLPLAHIFQRMLLSFNIARGVGLAFLHEPDPSVLVDDLKAAQPDIVSLVPRILTRFEAGIKSSLEKSGFQRNLATAILDIKQTRFTSKGGKDRSLMNSLVYHKILIDKIRQSLGLTNTSYMVTGSAPIAKDTLIFLRSALDVGMRQGYGLTETFAGVCLSEPYERDAGSCGAIGITVECRLKSVPAMGYDSEKDLKGELQIRGPQVFGEYYKMPKETKEAIDDEGWFSTGDVAKIDFKGRLHVIDRVKNFFKLAQGEYIAPEKIENNYLSSCPLITQIFVYGDSYKTYLVGVLGIDAEAAQKVLYFDAPNISSQTPDQLITQLNTDPVLRAKLLKIINSYVKHLQGFEKLHNIYVGLEPLKLEDDVVTPTLKIKRVKASKFFKDKLDNLYGEGSLVKNGKF